MHQYLDTPISGHLYLLNGRSSGLCFIPKDSSLYDRLATGKRAAVDGACENGAAKYAPFEKINIWTNESTTDGCSCMFLIQRSLQTSDTNLSYY